MRKPTLVVLTAVDEVGWKDWIRELGPAFAKALQLTESVTVDPTKFASNRKVLEKQHWAFATIAPRGIGPTQWSKSGPRLDIDVLRRFPLLGQTLDGQRVWDVRRGLAVLRDIPDLHDVSLWLQGSRQMAGIVLYAALFEPEVRRVDLWHPPASHRQGPYLLNVRKVLDMPQAIALALPRKMLIYVKDDNEAARWQWPVGLQKALGVQSLQIRKVSD